jgi:hypothetical protein
MSQTQIHLIQQAGEARVTFKLSSDAEATFSKLQESFPGRLELVAVATCRNVRATRQVLQMLHMRYQAYQEGDWYTLPAGELNALVFTFRAMNTAASTKAGIYQELTGRPRKQHTRSKLMKAVAWLEENDPELELSYREVAEEVGISHGTAANAVHYLLSLREAAE